MAKSSGLGDQLFIGGRDVGADVSAIGSLSTPRETLPATGITQLAMARMFGKRDGAAEFTTYFNVATDQIHDALKALPRTDVHVMFCHREIIGNPAAGLVAKQIDYNPTRGDDGSLTFAVSAQANAYGLDWCKQLTAGADTHASAASTTSLDTAASLSFGWQAYLQVFSLGSGTAEITIEDSANNTDWSTLSGGEFTDVTTRTFERLQSTSATATVRRYLRVTTSGTFTDLVFAVAINKNKNTRAI
jgi:hypothetical protein